MRIRKAALDGHDTQGTQVESPSEVGRCRFNQEAENCRRMEWAYYNSTNWISRLIQDLTAFYKTKNRNVDYHTMQILTGPGIFNHYWYKICKKAHTRC